MNVVLLLNKLVGAQIIDNANNLVFWCRFLNKPWYAVYIMQQ